MRRFVFLSFVFLFWAFYELSGGADYEPAPNSLQARARLQAGAPEPAAEAQAGAQTPAATATEHARALAQVDAAMAGLDARKAEAERLSVSLTAARASAAKVIEAEASRPKAELLELDLSGRRIDTGGAVPEGEAIDAAIAAALGEAPTDPARLRWVKEGVVDLRAGPGLTFDRVAQLSKGTEVAVLEDPGHGWLKVQVSRGFETGWLAEWLLTEPQ